MVVKSKGRNILMQGETKWSMLTSPVAGHVALTCPQYDARRQAPCLCGVLPQICNLRLFVRKPQTNSD